MFIFNYFLWHYKQAPKKILTIWGNFLRYLIAYFIPVGQLLRTLFSPWKRDLVSYGRGFDFKTFFDTLAMNLVSRIIGFMVRTIVIVFALAFEAFAMVLGAAFVIFWFVWPFFLVGSITSAIYYLTQTGLGLVIAPAVGVIDILSIIFFIWCYKRSRQKDPAQMTMAEVFQQNWAGIIWERIGLQKNQIPPEVISDPDQYLAEFLKKLLIHEKDFSNLVQWQVMDEAEKQAKKRFWEKENLFTSEGIGRGWMYGWTTNLDQYSSPIEEFRGSTHLIGRSEELESMERILCKASQSNVLLVGEPGVGKKTIVNQFAKFVRKGLVPSPLAWRRVINLDLNAALSGLTDEGAVTERLIRVFNEAAGAGNIILIIDQFHNFVSGQNDITPILTPFIEGGYFQMIALTDYENLHETLERDASLLKFFEKVEIKEPDEEQTLLVLQDSLEPLEKRAGRRVTYQALKQVVKDASQYIAASPMPEKAVDLLEETILYVAGNTDDRFVLPKHVDAVVSKKTDIPVGELEISEKDKLLNLEEFIHERVIGQELAVQEISSAMRRARLSVAATNRPMGSFLFLGPTGVGKTETAKALAQAYFGDEKRMLRFDMSEYQGAGALERMIGSSITNHPGLLTTAANENPFSLLLLDEIEKADAGILNLFLQILDEGFVTDAFGKKVNFRNMIIIATSNAASELIRQSVAQGQDPNQAKQKILDYIQQNNIFKPEFLNRFDGIVLFNPLTQQDILKIAGLLLNDLAKRLSTQDLVFIPTQPLTEKIASLGFDQNFGARAMRRVVQDKVEDLIAKKMLKGEIEKQVAFEIQAEEIN